MKTLSFKRILIPMDFSETGALALEQGIFMARLFKSHLFLLHVIEPFELRDTIYSNGQLLRDTKNAEGIVSDKLKLLAAKIQKKHSIHVSILIETGRVGLRIARAVKKNSIDIIVMGTHGAKGFEEYFIGSNAHKVSTIAPCPVITVQTHAKKSGFTNIVMPIDNSLHSREKINHVIELASRYKAKVHILGLLGSDEAVEENKLNIKLDSVEEVVKKAGVPYVRSCKKGKNIALEAMSYSNKVKANLIAIMTDHESNLTGMFLGGHAKQIINHSKIPVMSIKPNEHYITYQEIW